MRPLKFRIFDLLNQRWLTSGGTGWAEVLDLGAWQDESRWAISQFTGLKDKNGVDIWEGDIIHQQYGRGDGQPFVLRWGTHRNDEGYLDVGFYGSYMMKTVQVENESGFGLSATTKNLTVIGNQWQNPSLLT